MHLKGKSNNIMPNFSESKILEYSQKQLFDLVMDIDKYPTYLPWCKSVHIIEKTSDHIISDMRVGIAIISDTLRSKVTWQSPTQVDIQYVSGPFKNLNSSWTFQKITQTQTNITFHINFEGKGLLIKKAIDMAFSQASKLVISSFEKQAQQRYD